MTATLETLTDEELSAMWSAGGVDLAALEAECDRRDRAARGRNAARRTDAEWEDAAYAQYLKASAYCCGDDNMLSEAGKATGREAWPMLWQGSRETADRLASDDLIRFWDYEQQRIAPPGEIRAARAAAGRHAAEVHEHEGEPMIGTVLGAVRVAETIARASRAPSPVPVPKAEADAFAAKREELRQRRAARAAAREARTALSAPGTVPRTAEVELHTRQRGGVLQQCSSHAPVAAANGPQPYVDQDGEELHGDEWLDYMSLFFGRYVTWPSQAALDAAVLWAAHTYARAPGGGQIIWPATPRLFALAEGPDSGKSTVMRLLSMVCPKVFGIETEPTEYGLLLSIGAEAPTLVIDELGILLGSDKRKAGVQQILLNGYTLPRTGPQGTKLRERKGNIERVPLFAPIALAGMDVVEKTMSDNIRAILSRGVILRMKPAPDDQLPFDLDEEEDRVAGMVGRIRAGGVGWVGTNLGWLRGHIPEPAPGAARRWKQIWRPLLAVADGAGGDWPDRARAACVALRWGAADETGQNELAAMKDELDEAFPMALG